MPRAFVHTLFAVVALTAPAMLRAQDGNFLHPVATIETLLQDSVFRIADFRGSRAEGDRTQRVLLEFNDTLNLLGKWARAGRGASEFNNEPRYEIAAYRVQKLFLGADEYVVPPTVLRSFPLDYVQQHDPEAVATFDDANSVLVVLQYWLSAVTNEDFWDEDRFEQDSVYARHIANMNVLTHLIDHRDANVGNYLVSRIPVNPRVFSVDNGVAFRSQRSDRGTQWRNIRVDRLPHATVERLRAITEQDLTDALGVLYEFETRDGLLQPRPPGPNLDDGRGVRRRDGVVQLGLTRGEIGDVAKRLRGLIERIDEGKLPVF